MLFISVVCNTVLFYLDYMWILGWHSDEMHKKLVHMNVRNTDNVNYTLALQRILVDEIATGYPQYK